MTIYRSAIVRGEVRMPRIINGMTPFAFDFSFPGLPDPTPWVDDDVILLFPAPDTGVILADASGITTLSFSAMDVGATLEVAEGIFSEDGQTIRAASPTDYFQAGGAPPHVLVPSTSAIRFEWRNETKRPAYYGWKVVTAPTTPSTPAGLQIAGAFSGGFGLSAVNTPLDVLSA